MKKLLATTVAISALIASSAFAQEYLYTTDGLKKDPSEPFKGESYSPYAKRNFPDQLLWGDTHLHTKLSLDARAAGVILGQADAYRFARGDEITTSKGRPIRIGQPLDFLVVADHSDAMGAMNEVVAGNPDLLKDPTIKDWYERINAGGATQVDAAIEIVQAFTEGNTPAILQSKVFTKSIWDQVVETADEYNDPGRFTALIGYEWTSTPNGNNLHRNVIYRDDADKARQMLPYTVADSDNPEDLWTWLAGYEEQTGGRVLAIAHNGNLSNGIMFPVETNSATGQPLTGAYAKIRARWEPLYEITQIKGDGEAHSFLSPNDEFADYETWDRSNLGPVPKEDSMLQYEYAREALKNGLKLEASLGVNPYKVGLLGSTDSHTGLTTAEEDNFFGKLTTQEPSAGRMAGNIAHFEDIVWPGWYQVASGYTGVWAIDNTREAIFDAMMRREVYATTGPRIAVRFFGGWEFEEEDAQVRLPANIGYAKGVPMGGDLTNAPDGKAPTFLVAARKDSYSGNLDRIQIIKGWLDENGETQERIYDVVCSDGRRFSFSGKKRCRRGVGDTVDVEDATWTNTIGDPELAVVWEDPDFEADQRAFYYARVIEIPTPRWTAYEAKRFGVEAPEESPMTTQERAYTSPIWYTP
ncbi:MAG: DUF3604 domain-containing protein [Acidiferrobacterales bacterium]